MAAAVAAIVSPHRVFTAVVVFTLVFHDYNFMPMMEAFDWGVGVGRARCQGQSRSQSDPQKSGQDDAAKHDLSFSL